MGQGQKIETMTEAMIVAMTETTTELPCTNRDYNKTSQQRLQPRQCKDDDKNNNRDNDKIFG